MPNTVVEQKQYPVNPADYEILEDIGQGVSATVYRALCKPLNETVAIKSLDLEKCNSSLDDIRKEAQMMSLISHPNVVRAYCSFVKDQFLWVVMPYMAGGSCLHIMKSHHPDGFDEPVIATVLKETLKALDYLHHHGHIHRDVKAGNILIDQSGNVKLADFGVSACMFDTGDRQRARNTFCGTPCWMAPEVMEQLHGYDFKADIWSLGITALELAHGHAPFSKYPPMKVLLMTLQNAPPGLDYERDRKFSKAMKEMIAMCLVKDPTKRPTAEKLLKHAFFKQAKSPEFLLSAVLKGLPPLAERVKIVKAKDEARMAAKKTPLTAQELQSQNEYKRGVSDWNFNVDDLKQQAALIPEGDTPPGYPPSIKEEEEKSVRGGVSFNKGTEAESSDLVTVLSVPSDKAVPAESSAPVKEREKSGEIENIIPQQSSSEGSVRKSTTASQKPTNGQKSGESRVGGQPKKEAQIKGRFEVIEGDQDDDEEEEKEKKRNPEKVERSEKEREREKEKDRDRSRLGPSSSFEREREREREREKKDREKEKDRGEDRERGDRERRNERDRDHRKGGSGEDSHRLRHSERERDRDRQSTMQNGPLANGTTPARGLQQSSSKESIAEEKYKSEKEKGHEKIHRKGRFSVVTDEGPDDVPLPKKIVLPSEKIHSQPATPGSGGEKGHVTATSLLPHIQTLMKHTTEQQEALYQLVSILMPSEGRGIFSRSSSEEGNESKSDRERDLFQQVVDLQAKVHALEKDLQNQKVRNSQLERQLNVFFNKEEEERIRQEEARKDDN